MPLFENRRLCLCRNSLLRDRILWDAGGLPAILLRSRSCPARHQLQRLRDPKWAGQEASQSHSNHVAHLNATRKC
ncbi:hypothetical protein NDU88_004912 [Pleurodeles waltl]|uniref:Uncharacterized protein n=1 Tax=Pleurodeles waltl TaxID=8319 RepID=A0AAV7NL13_PLEWA|nr:hypothetical protein NDU88_004912 [Pleurodeles waltl]